MAGRVQAGAAGVADQVEVTAASLRVTHPIAAGCAVTTNSCHAEARRSIPAWEFIGSLIFGSILTGVRATTMQLYVAIAFVIIVNAVLSHWLALRGRGWGSIAREFLVMAVVNLGLVYLADFLLRRGGGALNLPITLFFVLLLTLIVTLYDRYHLVYQARFATKTETQ
jgi:hypothetical protein